METQLHAKDQKKISNGQGCRTGTHARTDERTYERTRVNLQVQNSQIGLKWTKFHYSMAKNLPYQNFPGIQSMISSKKIIRTNSIPKIRKIHSGVWKSQVNKRAMLRSLGDDQIIKNINGGGQRQSSKSKNFLAHSTEAKSLRATILTSVQKSSKSDTQF